MLDNRIRGIFVIALIVFLPVEDSYELRITDDPFSQWYPAIYGNIVVWEDHRNSSSFVDYRDIYGYDLVTKEEFQITEDPSFQEKPAIYGNTVVWEDYRNGNYDIYGYDLVTKEEFQITEDTSNQKLPAIYEETIVWADNRNGNYDIYGYDLSAGKEFPIIVNSTDQIFPAIYDDIVVWMDSANDQRYNIYGYDLSTEEEFQIAPESSDQWWPAIYDDIVVWADSRHGKSDIYCCNLQVMRDVRKADSLFDQGKEEFEKKNYEAALDYFQQAREIYLSVKSEKAAECDQWIQKTQEEMKKGFCLGTLLMALLVAVGSLILQKR